MFLWTDPFKQNVEKERSPEQGAAGLVSARWLALDSILRSLILDPEGPELRAMMRRDLRMMEVAGKSSAYVDDKNNAYKEAAEVMTTFKNALSK